MYEIKCEICNQIFKSEHKGREKGNLIKHLKLLHLDVTPKEYYTKYHCNGIVPKCKCGCGIDTQYYKFKYFLYVSDHKNYDKINNNGQNINLRKSRIKFSDLDFRLKSKNLEKIELKKYFDKFNTTKYSLDEIAKELNIDKRTMKKFWIELEISSKKEIETLCKKTKYLGILESVKNRKITDNTLNEIMLFLEDCKERQTISQVKYLLKIEHSERNILKSLQFKYGDEIFKHLKLGSSSGLEYDFYFILKFYFGGRIKSKFVLENKYYDYILDNKILIELDGTHWHSSESAKANDKYKDELALKYNYQIIRIDELNIKNIETLNSIIELSKK